jgi:seryl-tRNA synthetase
MLDNKLLRSDPHKVAQLLLKRGFVLDVDYVEELERTRKRLNDAVEKLQSERNRIASEMGRITRSVKDSGQPADTTLLMMESKNINTRLEAGRQQLNVVKNAWELLVSNIPNIPDDVVPFGKSDADNVVVHEYLLSSQFKDFQQYHDHVKIGELLNGLDFETAGKISGSRFSILKGDIARLHRALVQFMLNTHTDVNGYTEINVPVIVNDQALFGTGQLPKFEQDLFKLTDVRDLYLIPTAEVPLTNMYRDTIISPDKLPIKMVCSSQCFRSEAGSAGRDTRGLIRQHQFEKVELVQICHPDNSDVVLDGIVRHAENILQLLGLPYRTVLLCGGDLGFASAKTFDIEVWLPSQNTFREISSCSNMRDFQSRRLMIRYRENPNDSPKLVHTLNGSGLAIGRTLVAILENYQSEDGSIHIPTVLQPYMNNRTKIDIE